MESPSSISRHPFPDHSSFPSPSNCNSNSTNPLLDREADNPSANAAAPCAPSIVTQSTIGITLYTIVGVVVYVAAHKSFKGVTTFVAVDGLYFTVVTLCTVGYGDVVPRTDATKLFVCGLVLVGFGFVGVALNALLEHVLDQQEQAALHALDTSSCASALAACVVDARNGRMRVRVKAGLAAGVLVAILAVGTVMARVLEQLGWIDSFYLAVVSVTTVGYGDYSFVTLWGRVFASIWLPLSTFAVARSFLILTELRMEKRARRTAERVVKRQMTARDAAAADLDGNGYISKSEYVIYKLKEMGKVTDKDIMQICNQFDKLDSGQCGKITLSDLIDSHH